MTTANLGTAALPEGGRSDFATLRAERLSRVLEDMARREVDVLLLGREANARFVSGARRLWFAGTRPFVPGCIVVRETGHVHLMTQFDEGIPAEIPHDRIFTFTWNPMNLMTTLQQIPGVAGAARVGVDSMTPLFQQLLPMAIPAATLVDGEDLLRSVRMRKSPAEIECMATAVSIAEAAMAAAIAHLHPGVREKDLLGRFDERMAALGVTTPSMEGTFSVAGGRGDTGPMRRLASDQAINDGELVALSSGVLYAGYEGVVGRTWLCSRSRRPSDAQRELYARWRTAYDAIEACLRPGATGAELRSAYEATGGQLPAFPFVYSVGIGYEAPIAGSALGPAFDEQWVLEAGMTLAVQPVVAGDAGSFFATEVVHVTDDGPRRLTTLGHGPLSDGE